ncbi:MAG TPA: heparan-alpha-glucosaminide N-acetyltransferase domain-containing protein, partial [Chitinophagaceae bacterium]|nr:heparan-alpha-glucosaminide N-acetyltransferase domain-containing protein [Chitinophagaceae bacterium]
QLQRNYRIQSIDLLRGLVMVIMALDHTRDYFHWSAFHYDPLDFSQTTAPIFLTRWITHFCAPIFVFLAGTSAYLIGIRKGKKVLSKFLLTRGLWLLFLEITVVGFGISFNWYFNFLFLQVIWALGISMIVLSFLIYLPKRILLLTGIIIIAAHNSLDNIHVGGNGVDAFLWSALHEPKFFSYSPFQIMLLYPVLAWIGVMIAGYCFGELYTRYDTEKRKKILIALGIGCIILFIIIRATNIYGDQLHWEKKNTLLFTFLSFINTTKYPPSLLYILMTIGPGILFLGLTERPLNRFGKIISVYGKVPMFYYVLHFYIIHLVSVIAGLINGYSLNEMINGAPGGQPLQNFGYHLWVVYLIWISIVALLYPLCRWYSNYKLRNPQKWWLSYL